MRRASTVHEEDEEQTFGSGNGKQTAANPYEPLTTESTPPPREHGFAHRLGFGTDDTGKLQRRSVSGRRKGQSTDGTHDMSSIQRHNAAEAKRANGDPTAPKAGLGPRPVGGSEKLGMFSGVYVPTCLNVLSILMFLRFGFITGTSFSTEVRPGSKLRREKFQAQLHHNIFG